MTATEEHPAQETTATEDHILPTENEASQQHQATEAHPAEAAHATQETHSEVSLAAEKIFSVGPLDVTNAMLTSWIVTVLLIAGVFVAAKSVRLIPRGAQNFLESILEALYNLMEGIAGNRAKIFFPLLATFFLFIILNNWAGLLPGVGSVGFHVTEDGHKSFVPIFRAATSDLNTTLALALVSVAVTQWYGIKSLGILGYVTHYFHSPVKGSIWLVSLGMVIGIFIGFLELVSEFVKIVSLSFRLFGNVYAGEAVLHTVSGILAFFAPIPFLLLEVIVGFVQAAVFMMLTLVFLAIITEKHGDEHA